MPKALVLGVNGQDGSYLAQALLRRGYEVVGVGRQPHSRYFAGAANFTYAQADIQDQQSLQALLQGAQPDAVFHAAAVHGAAGFEYEPVFAAMMAVNVVSVQTVLEYARRQRPALRLVYANSAKILAGPLSGTISEQSRIAPSCLYSIGKIAALELIRYYRQQHRIAGVNLILFNHESPRRPREYFVPTLARGLAASLTDRQHRLSVQTLDFCVDWSSAEELMDIAVDICERAPTEDFVLASGVTVHARAVVQELFAQHGLDYRQHVIEALPPREVSPAFTVDLSHLQDRTGRRPVRTVASVVTEVVRASQVSPQS